MIHTVEMDFEFQNTIPGPPVSMQSLQQASTCSDEVTVSTWQNQWLDQIRKNSKKYGSFAENSIAQLYQREKGKAAILVGSGPSLKKNIADLREAKDICKVSCLHNFHLLEDNGAPADYYVTLDAGSVTIEEVYEGGSRTPEEYWEITKDRVLLAWIGTHPELLSRWQGKILWFNSPIGQPLKGEIDAIERFNLMVSSGGNVLGACLYIAKGILGAPVSIFVGADFSFSYTKQFHGWSSKYDGKLGDALRHTDIWGNKVFTWQSYYNFKCWFEMIACKVPGVYINATEGGILGAYPQGNIAQIQQMTLKRALAIYNMAGEIEEQIRNPQTENLKILF